jgi:hypothetical protein
MTTTQTPPSTAHLRRSDAAATAFSSDFSGEKNKKDRLGHFCLQRTQKKKKKEKDMATPNGFFFFLFDKQKKIQSA